MASQLPAPLRAAILDINTGRSLLGIAEKSRRISDTYRAGGTSSGVRDEDDVAAYLFARLPATFAAVDAALSELQSLKPDFLPTSVLDIGCGPGTALFAALERFPGITSLSGLDANERFLVAAQDMMNRTGYAASKEIEFRRGDFRKAIKPDERADLVIMAYALAETPEALAESVASQLFAATRQALVLVEPGSTAGFGRIRLAREALVKAGAHILAPCTHQARCPIIAPDWCHFSVRLARSREHQRAKSATVPYEDEKFSYLVALRDPVKAHPASRIIAPAHVGKGETAFKICNETGIEIRHISRRSPEFGAIRKREWGEILPKP